MEAVVFGHGNGEAEAAGFEGSGGIGSFFLDVKARVALAVEHGRPTFTEGNGGYFGQNTGVAPHAEAGRGGGGAGGDIFTPDGLFEMVEVVPDVKGAGAEGTDGLWGVGGNTVVTTRAFERNDLSHIYQMLPDSDYSVLAANLLADIERVA